MSSKIKEYEQLRRHTELPMKSRRKLAIGRGGARVIPRTFHITDARLKALQDEFAATGKFVNPYNKGSYHYLVQALVDLGTDKAHPKSRVFKKMQTLMSAEETIDKNGLTAWERFEGRNPRNDNGRDLLGRMDQNVDVMQRLTSRTPYALKLLEAGQKVMGWQGGVIDLIVADTGTEYLRLNTESNVPQKRPSRRTVNPEPVQEAEDAAVKVAQKAKAKKAKAEVETESVETESVTI